MTTNNSKSKQSPSNFVIFTLQAINDGEMKVSASGKPYSFVRAFLSQGKDKKTAEYKPSIFFDVKTFSESDEISPIVQAVADLAKKERFTVKGRLGLEEWTGKNEEKRQKLVIFAKSIEPFSFDGGGSTADEDNMDEEELEGEPA